MVKTILLPTDFSVRSLQIIRCVLEENPVVKLDLVHTTGLTLPSSILDLLFFSKKELIEKLSGEVFIEACQVIRNKYASRIHDMRFEVFTGYTQMAFNVFLEGQGVQKIYLPGNKLDYKRPCFDPTAFMKRSKLPQQTVSWKETQPADSNRLADLFINWA